MADHDAVRSPSGLLDDVEGLRERPDLVDLDQDGRSDALPDRAAQAFGVRDEDVVPHHLAPAAEL